jgi:site-specific recombinase XerD
MHSQQAFTITSQALEAFSVFCRVDLQRSDKTVKMHINALRRFSKEMGNTIDANKIRTWLCKYRNNNVNPRTYRWFLCAIKVFCRDYLRMPQWVETLKFPRIDLKLITQLPSKEQLTAFYHALPHGKARAIFLLYCSSGLRKSEIFDATINQETRAIAPNSHEQYSTKNSYVSFYNSETEQLLRLINYNINASESSVRRWFKIAYHKTKIRITPQMLRQWFCVQMTDLGVSDRYIDCFCGRTPHSILARHYTDYSPMKLKQIYDKANLTVLSNKSVSVT